MTRDPASMLSALAELGLPASVVASFAAVFDVGGLTLDDRRFLTGPLVVHRSPWNEGRPKWMDIQAVQERVLVVFGQLPRHIIGPSEIAAVMYGASMDAPLGHEWHELYLWAAAQAVARRDGGKRPGCIETLDDDVFLSPDGRYHHSYRELAQDVRRRVVTLQAGRERETRTKERLQDKPTPLCSNTPKAQPATVAVQMSLLG
jgi:hypothetical protein